MTVPPEAITDATEALSVHRWNSMSAASAECECGEILYGPGLTQFPADEAFRRHLAEAVLQPTVPLIAAASHRVWLEHVIGYQIGGKIYHPSDVQIVLRGDQP